MLVGTNIAAVFVTEQQLAKNSNLFKSFKVSVGVTPQKDVFH
jgi:hypothetical protein